MNKLVIWFIVILIIIIIILVIITVLKNKKKQKETYKIQEKKSLFLDIIEPKIDDIFEIANKNKDNIDFDTLKSIFKNNNMAVSVVLPTIKKLFKENKFNKENLFNTLKNITDNKNMD